MPAKSKAQQQAAGAALFGKEGRNTEVEVERSLALDGRFDEREAIGGIRAYETKVAARTQEQDQVRARPVDFTRVGSGRWRRRRSCGTKGAARKGAI